MLNSNEEFLIDGFLEVSVINVEAYQGGRRQKGLVDYQTKQKKSTAYIKIENTDNMCMARAIVVSKAFVDNDPQYASIRNSCKRQKKTCRQRKDVQTVHAKALCEAAGVDHTKVCGIEEAEKFQAYLIEYQLCIISREHNETVIFKGPDGREKFIYIHLDGNHYNAITKITGYLGKGFFCHKCKKGRSNKEHPYCEAFCKFCQGNECKNYPIIEPYIVCNDCKCCFKNKSCFDTHKKNMFNSEQSRCQVFYRCLECSHIKDSRKFPKK